MKHTPGPWHIDTHENYVSQFRIYTEVDGSNVVWVDPDEETIEQGEANARLIASAPQLLEALIFIVNSVPEPGEDAILNVEGYNKACEAISRATINP